MALGEPLVEFAPEGDDRYRLGFAGDTLNTAIYLSRLGVDAAFATALGADDPFSDRIVERVLQEGVDDGLIRRLGYRPPGLYLIDVDPNGERRFHYWRDAAPIRTLFASQVDAAPLLAGLLGFDWLYISGITLAVIGPLGRDMLWDALSSQRASKLRTMLDLNVRPKLWPDLQTAREAVAPFTALASIISMSDEDHEALGGAELTRTPESARGDAEIVHRRNDGGVTMTLGSCEHAFCAGPRSAAVDTTGAGDAFNAAYLAARLTGAGVEAAVRAGQRLASQVVKFRGAIVPLEAMSS